MRAYLPLRGPELRESTPPNRNVCWADTSTLLEGESEEDTFEDALDEASFCSLELVQESKSPGGRIVAVGELKAGSTSFESWQQIDSLMIDGPGGTEIVQQIGLTDDAEKANLLVEELFEQPLEWFDITERQAIANGI